MSDPVAPNERAREYLKKAQEAEAKAEQCKDAQAAATFRNIAKQWLALAKRAGAQIP